MVICNCFMHGLKSIVFFWKFCTMIAGSDVNCQFPGQQERGLLSQKPTPSTELLQILCSTRRTQTYKTVSLLCQLNLSTRVQPVQPHTIMSQTSQTHLRSWNPWNKLILKSLCSDNKILTTQAPYQAVLLRICSKCLGLLRRFTWTNVHM